MSLTICHFSEWEDLHFHLVLVPAARLPDLPGSAVPHTDSLQPQDQGELFSGASAVCRGGYWILLQLFLSVKTETNKSYCLFVGPVVHEFDHLVRLSGGLGSYDKQWSNSPALHSFTASLPSDINETVFTSHPHSYLCRCSRALGRMRLFITDPSRGVYPPLTAGLQSHWSAGHIVYSNAW